MKSKKASIELTKIYWTYPASAKYQRTIKDKFIETIQLKKSIELNRKHHLSDLSLSVSAGQKLGIVGHNGSGKSTLLRVIAGVLKPNSGQVEVDGVITPIMDLGSTLNPQLSCRDNSILALCALGLEREVARGRTGEILDWADLLPNSGDPLFSLSSGMQSRLLFAIATSQEPDIILIDELLSVGDSAFKQKAKDRMNNFISSGSINIVVSHDVTTLLEMTDEVIWLKDGSIFKRGPSVDVLREYEAQKNPG